MHYDHVGFILRIHGWLTLKKSINVFHHTHLKRKVTRLYQILQKKIDKTNATS